MAHRESTLPFASLVAGAEVGIRNDRVESGLGKFVLEELARSILDNGLLNRLHVWQTTKPGDGANKAVNAVTAGERRLRALAMLADGRVKPKAEDRDAKRKNEALAALLKAVPVLLLDAKDQPEVEILALVDNVQREDLSIFEIAMKLHSLKTRGMQQREMAKRINKSESWVSRVLAAYRDASPELKQAWQDGELPFDTVEPLSKKPEPEQKAAVAKHKDIRKKGTRAAKGESARAAGKADRRTPSKASPKASPLTASEEAALAADAGALACMREPAFIREPDVHELASREMLEGLWGMTRDAPAGSLSRGVHLAMSFALGMIGDSEFDDEWFAERRAAAAAAKSAEDGFVAGAAMMGGKNGAAAAAKHLRGDQA